MVKYGPADSLRDVAGDRTALNARQLARALLQRATSMPLPGGKAVAGLVGFVAAFHDAAFQFISVTS